MFNFDELAALAKSDPQAFEDRRQQLIADEILKAPADQQSKLLVLQRELDETRSRIGGERFLKYCMHRIKDNLDDLDDQFRCVQAIVAGSR